MHARNPYRVPPSFDQLAIAYPDLSPYVKRNLDGTSTIDFKDDAAQRCLTKALLHRDFGTKLDLPVDRLCPPVPNRLNYVLWIQDIVRATYAGDGYTGPVRGIDIGTGASAIYPLLACALEPSWSFSATEIDNVSLSFARKNVVSNNLQDRINVVQVHPYEPLLAPLAETSSTDIRYHFTMCNPPFYSSSEDIERSTTSKEFEPHAVCTGVDVEMITTGGEEAFVSQMVRESLEHKARCMWYTSMLGKMSSLSHIVDLLRGNDIDNYAITEFIQGQTRRWAIGWSFGENRLPDSLARISNPALQSIMPRRNTLHQPFPAARSATDLADALHAVLSAIDAVASERDGEQCTILVRASSNTWSRAARRRKMVVDQSPLECMMCCKVECVEASRGSRFEVVYIWVEGTDRAMYESFVGHVSRKVGAVIASGGP